MSLLMKALEKAAKDREQTGTERPAPAAASNRTVATGAAKTASELSLEPLANQRAMGPGAESAAMPTRTAPGAPSVDASNESARAAALLRAGQREAARSAVVDYAREHPLIAFGTFAGLFLVVYGTYVYLEITRPSLFVTQPPVAAQSTPRPVVRTPPTTAGDSSVPSSQPPTALIALLPSLQDGAETAKMPPPPPAIPATNTGIASEPPVAVPARPSPAPRPAALPEAPRETIKVIAGGGLPAVNPTLTEAYQSLSTGNLETSQRLYNQLLRSDPNNVDVLLGLAAIATQQSDSAQASRHYMRVLEVEPRNALAHAGLIAILGRADPAAAESRLKQLIAREPSAYLYFTLGNVYSDQGRWPDAQQAYFQAYHLQPNNPDYAYNLAIGLEHIGQPQLALNYYRGALELATAGRANFSLAAAQDRISKLEKTVP